MAFIGLPLPVAAIEAMGDKIASKKIAAEAGVSIAASYGVARTRTMPPPSREKSAIP
ncbi:MAG: hypothetical protein R3F54_22300 [Alphaproteobacteria bacterium]